MKLGYALELKAPLEFYKKAFELEIGYLHEVRKYGQIKRNSTTILAFASERIPELNGLEIRPNRSTERSGPFEIALVAQNVDGAYEKAIAGGAKVVETPADRPLAQRVGYVSDLNGVLEELFSSKNYS
jgi:lactoylglutathione lyase